MRVAPTSRLAGPLRSQDRPGIGRSDPSADGLRVFVGRIHERQCMRHPRKWAVQQKLELHNHILAEGQPGYFGSEADDGFLELVVEVGRDEPSTW